jgi:hypothetical protein
MTRTSKSKEKTAYPGRYPRAGPARRRHIRECPQPQRGEAAARDPPTQVCSVEAHLGV